MKRLIALACALICPQLWGSPLPSGDDYFHSLLCYRPAAPPRTTVTSEANTRLHTRFDPQQWSGELSKERLTPAGKTTELWRASEQMPRPRQIKFNSSGASPKLADFDWAALDEAQQLSLNTDPQGGFDGYGAARVKLLRGEECSGLEGCPVLRQELPALGDIVNASPLLVAAPNRDTTSMESYDGSPGAYAAFKARQRRAQIYVGANDGMLHAFDAQSGEERLAIIPTAILAKLPALTSPTYTNGDPHRFFVDGPVVAQDVFFADAWHTVLLVSLGAGGRGLLALDVTDPERVELLWEFDSRHDEQLGYLLTAPTIARLHTGQWAAVLGNGIDAPAGSAALLLLDIQTGTMIKRLPTPIPATGLAMPLVADTDGDGNADYAYAGDNLGNLWRFDLYEPSQNDLNNTLLERPSGSSAFRLAFAGQPLFRTPAIAGNQQAQPITQAPAIISHPTEWGYLIIVGTGQNHLAADHDRQSLYAIWDRHTRNETAQAVSTISVADLQEQRVSAAPGNNSGLSLSHAPIDWRMADHDAKGSLGWYINLQAATAQAAGERLLGPPRRLGELLTFSTRVPSAVPCQADIQTRLYVIDPNLGGGTLFPVFDLNEDGLVNIQDIGSGPAPSAIAIPADTQVVATPTGMPCVLGASNCAPLSLGPRANGRQSWRVVSDGTP